MAAEPDQPMPPLGALTRAKPTVHVQYTKALLVVAKGPNAGTKIEVSHTPLRIGSAPDNGLVLSDDLVSRHHCEISTSPLGIRVRDEDSTNGILVGSLRVTDAIFNNPF